MHPEGIVCGCAPGRFNSAEIIVVQGRHGKGDKLPVFALSKCLIREDLIRRTLKIDAPGDIGQFIYICRITQGVIRGVQFVKPFLRSVQKRRDPIKALEASRLFLLIF